LALALALALFVSMRATEVKQFDFPSSIV
jgi:hypothetical protein